jgi:hypothetical protein
MHELSRNEGKEEKILQMRKWKMQSYHLYVGQLESLSLSLSLEHVYVQVVVIEAHIFLGFTS